MVKVLDKNVKNKGDRAIGKHLFQHRFWYPDGKSNEAVFISRFSTALLVATCVGQPDTPML